MTHVGTNSYLHLLYNFIRGKKKAIEQLEIHKTVNQICRIHSFIFCKCFMQVRTMVDLEPMMGTRECEAGTLAEMPVHLCL